MQATIYLNEHVHCFFTTDAPGSRYGIPVMRCQFADRRDWPDLGPADELPSGITAAELVCKLSYAFDAELTEAAKLFCGQWPEGPQLP